jgi:hypothetical protein
MPFIFYRKLKHFNFLCLISCITVLLVIVVICTALLILPGGASEGHSQMEKYIVS